MISKERLIDIEELKLRIIDATDREFFHEAGLCYFIGSNRGALMLAWNLTCFNMKRKLARLASEDGKAKPYWSRIQKSENQNKSIEEDLVNAFKALDMITESEHHSINHIRKLRNQCAHPSEYTITPEEVRSSFRVLVDVILSKRFFRGHTYLRKIESSLGDEGYLPEENYAVIVHDIIAHIRPEILPNLARQLVSILNDENSDKSMLNNADKVLASILSFKCSSQILDKVIDEVANISENRISFLATSFRLAPSLYSKLELSLRERIIRTMIEGKSTRLKMLDWNHSLLTSFATSELQRGSDGDWIKPYIRSNIFNVPEIAIVAKDHFSEDLFEKIIEELTYAGWNNFDRNNSATNVLKKVGLNSFTHLGDDRRKEMSTALLTSASLGSKQPIDFLDGDFKEWSEPWKDSMLSVLKDHLGSAKNIPASLLSNAILYSTNQSKKWSPDFNVAFDYENKLPPVPKWFPNGWRSFQQWFFDLEEKIMDIIDTPDAIKTCKIAIQDYNDQKGS